MELGNRWTAATLLMGFRQRVSGLLKKPLTYPAQQSKDLPIMFRSPHLPDLQEIRRLLSMQLFSMAQAY
jgi:hypothetical protein